MFLLTALILMCAVCTQAQGVRERMKDRLPAIVELKNRGIIGENNRGYLEFIGDNREEEAMISEENRDRSAVYDAIAKQQGSEAETVGQRRAIQIAERAGTGDWLQDENGNWYQKK